jgi:hypothetical protein
MYLYESEQLTSSDNTKFDFKTYEVPHVLNILFSTSKKTTFAIALDVIL